MFQRAVQITEQNLGSLAQEQRPASRQVGQHRTRRQQDLAEVQQVRTQLGDASKYAVVHVRPAQLVLQAFDALLHQLLNFQIVFDQVIPKLVK